MVSLAEAIGHLYPAADLSPGGNVRIVNDGGGDRIAAWDAALGQQPTGDQIAAAQIDVAKAQKRAEIDAARHAANTSNFEHGGARIQCDALSRSDIDAIAQHVALTGALPADFPGVWKGRDAVTDAAVYLPLATPEAFKAMHAAMVAAGTANFMRSESRKQAIENASTVEDVQAVIW